MCADVCFFVRAPTRKVGVSTSPAGLPASTSGSDVAGNDGSSAGSDGGGTSSPRPGTRRTSTRKRKATVAFAFAGGHTLHAHHCSTHKRAAGQPLDVVALNDDSESDTAEQDDEHERYYNGRGACKPARAHGTERPAPQTGGGTKAAANRTLSSWLGVVTPTPSAARCTAPPALTPASSARLPLQPSRKDKQRSDNLAENTARLTAVHALGPERKDTPTNQIEQQAQVDDIAVDIMCRPLTTYEERQATEAATGAYQVLARQSQPVMARSLQKFKQLPQIKTMHMVYDAMADLRSYMGGDGPRMHLLADYASAEVAVQTSIVQTLAERVQQLNHKGATREQRAQLKTVLAFVTDPAALRGGAGGRSLISTYKALLGVGQKLLDGACRDQVVFKAAGSAALVVVNYGERSDKTTQNLIGIVSQFLHTDGVSYVNKGNYSPKRVYSAPGVYEEHERRVLASTVHALVPEFLQSPQYLRFVNELSGRQRHPKKHRGWRRSIKLVLNEAPWITKREPVQCACPIHTDAENGQPHYYKYLRKIMAKKPAWARDKLRQHASGDDSGLGAFQRRARPPRSNGGTAAFANHLASRAASASGDNTDAASSVAGAARKPAVRQLDCEACFAEAISAGLGAREAIEYVADRHEVKDGECDHVRVHRSPAWTVGLLACAAVRKQEIEYPGVDERTGRELDTPSAKFALPPKVCVDQDCTDCGVDVLHQHAKQVNGAYVLNDKITQDVSLHRVSSFQKRPVGVKIDAKTGKETTNWKTEWLAVDMTGLQWAKHMQDKYLKYLPHGRRTKLNRQHIKREHHMISTRAAWFEHDTNCVVEVMLALVASLVVETCLDEATGAVPSSTSAAACLNETFYTRASTFPRLSSLALTAAATELLPSSPVFDVHTVVRPPPLPQECLMNPYLLYFCWHDYASKCQIEQGYHLTAQFCTSLTVDVRLSWMAPRVVMTSSLTDEPLRKALEEEGCVAQVVMPLVLLFVITNHDHDHVLNAQAQRDEEALHATGRLHQDTKNAVCIVDNKVVLGSKSFTPLDDYDADVYHQSDVDRLEKHTEPVELIPGRGLPGRGPVRYRADGAGTYTKNDARYSNGQVPGPGTRAVYSRNTEYHGSYAGDSLGSMLQRYARERNLTEDNKLMDGGHHLAIEFALAKGGARYDLNNPGARTKRGRGKLPPNQPYQIVVIYYGVQGVEEQMKGLTSTSTKFPGVTSYRGFQTTPEELSARGRIVPLSATMDACSCDSCMAMHPGRCKQSDNPRVRMVHEPPIGVAANRDVRRAPGAMSTFEGWAAKLCGGMVVAAVVDHAAKNNAEEEFFLARLRGPPWVNPKTQTFGANEIKAGFWVAEMDWFEHIRTMQTGSMKYYFDAKPDPVIYQLNALIKGADKYLSKGDGFTQDKGKGKRGTKPNVYTLTHTAFSDIVKYCNLG